MTSSRCAIPATYVSPLLDRAGLADARAAYFWVWGVGGLVGSFAVGQQIDGAGASRLLMALILTILALTLAALPVLLGLEPDHGSVAVALNSSANYLGGVVMALAGVNTLPVTAAGVAAALMLRRAILSRRRPVAAD